MSKAKTEAMDTSGSREGNGPAKNSRFSANNGAANNGNNLQKRKSGPGPNVNPKAAQSNNAAANHRQSGGGQNHQQQSGGHRGNQGPSNDHRERPDGGQERHWKNNNVPLLGAPTYELPVKEKDQIKKFTGRCRLFVANLPGNVTEDSLKTLFKQYGDVSEVFLGKGNAFAFIKMDTRKNAEEARSALDFSNYENRTLRVRLAAHAAAIRVKNLSTMVTNDLLEYAFSYFGEVERAIVIADDRGRSIGEGIVEFARKSSAQNALKRCTQESFLLTAVPRPVLVEPFEQKDEDEGFADKHINKHQADFRMERELGPRFTEPGSFEYEFGMRWKALYDLEKSKRDRLEIEINEARQQLQEQMEYAKVEHQTKLLKEKLREMEEQTGKFAAVRSDRMEEDRRREEERQREELYMRQREEDILRRQQVQDFGSLRRQETDLRQQATALQDMLNRDFDYGPQQELAIRQATGGGGDVGGYAGEPMGGYGQPGPRDAYDGYGQGPQDAYASPVAFQGQGPYGNSMPLADNMSAGAGPMDMGPRGGYGPPPPHQGPGPLGPGPFGPVGMGGPGPMPGPMGRGPPQQQHYNRPGPGPPGQGGPAFNNGQKRRRY